MKRSIGVDLFSGNAVFDRHVSFFFYGIEEKNLIFGEGKIFVFTSNTVGKYWKMIETVDAIFLFRFINYLSGRRLNVHIRDIYVKKRCDVIRRINILNSLLKYLSQ